jgi:uncharacterized membrane protein
MQAISFALIGRRFASRYGFIPHSKNFDSALEALTLERVLLVAGALVIVGVIALGWGFTQWAERGFGPLPLSSTMRAMIVAMTTLVAGLQLAMSAFMASMIDVPLNERRVTEVPREDYMVRRAEDRR